MKNVASESSTDARFFRLTKSSLASLSHLKRSELLIYLYLKCQAPFPWLEVELDMSELRAVTGIKSMGTVYPALAELHKQGLIVWLHVKSNVQVMDKNCLEREIDQPADRRSAGRSQDQPADRTIGGLIDQPPKPPHNAASHAHKSIKSNKSKNKEGGFIFPEEYIRWISSAIDALPRQPKGLYRDELIQRELEDPENLETFHKAQELRDQALFSAAAAAAAKFEALQLEEPEDPRAASIRRKRGLWHSNKKERAAIRLWCEENNVFCDDKEGPSLENLP
jgi:hypothetical protein